ncbi:hypothetical protein [Streptomyces sp. NBC_00344]
MLEKSACATVAARYVETAQKSVEVGVGKRAVRGVAHYAVCAGSVRES